MIKQLAHLDIATKYFFTFLLVVIFILLTAYLGIKLIFMGLYGLLLFAFGFINLFIILIFFFEFIWRDQDWKVPKRAKESIYADFLGKIGEFKAFKLVKNLGEFLIFYFTIDLFIYTIQGYYYTKKKSENLTCDTHDAVVICNKGFKIRTFYGYGFNNLIEFFIKNDYSYKIYECNHFWEFESLIKNPSVTSLWIFGHGKHGGVNIGGFFYDYSLFKNQEFEKDYVYQFHCNPGLGESLASIVSGGNGYVNNKINTSDFAFWKTYEILKSFDYDNNKLKS